MSEVVAFDVEPGVISALLFIGLDILALGILDIVLSRVVCLFYYYSINKGSPISVRSVDIPGLTNYLVGRHLYIPNIFALAAKLALLAIVFFVNLNIDTETKFVVTRLERDATFDLSFSDEKFVNPSGRPVRGRPERVRTCLEERDDDDSFTYYHLAFNLVGNVVVDPKERQLRQEPGKQIDIDDNTILCMRESEVQNPRILIKVAGCVGDRPCLEVSEDVDRKFVPEAKPFSEAFDDIISHNYTDYEQSDINELWPEYSNPKLTCLSTWIGVSALNGGQTIYTQCLLIVRNGTHTIVERRIIGPDKDTDRPRFILEHPGVVFEGDFDIGRTFAASYLQVPFPFTDYGTLSGELVAIASVYARDPMTIFAKEAIIFERDGKEEEETVTTIPVWALGLVGGSVAVVLLARLITFLILRNDTRPRFNTINGLSSIVREEHAPSGRSYELGEKAILGLRFTDDDNLHFGPLSNPEESACYQDGYDIS